MIFDGHTTSIHTRRVYWFDEFELNRALTIWREGGIPLVEPRSLRLRERWARVLANAYSAPLGSPAPSPAPLIVDLDPRVSAVANFYAALRGAGSVISFAADRLSELAELESERALLLFGLGDVFTPHNLAAIATATSRPVGLATARDEPALVFLAVKMAIEASEIGGGAGRSLVAFDEINGVILSRSGHPPTSEEHIFDTSLRTRLLEENVRHGVVLHVHGEGSHANLRSVVLCGADSGGESWAGMSVPGGCKIEPTRWCKRAWTRAAMVEGFDALPDREVAMLSCNGLSVAGTLFPSMSSAVFSLIEGHTVRVLCNDRTVPMRPEDVRMVTALLTAGASLYDVSRLLNDRERFRSRASPWFLIGEPRPGFEKLDPERTNRILAEHGIVQNATGDETGTLTLPADIAIQGAWRGAHAITLLLSPGPTMPSLLLSAAESERVEAMRNAIEGLRRCASVSLLVAEVRRRRHLGQDATGASKEDSSELERTLSVTEQAFAKILHLCELARTDGLMPRRLSLAIDIASLAMSACDRQLAVISERELLEGSAENVLLTGYSWVNVEGSEPCPRCHLPMPRESYESAYDPTAILVEMRCPNCGPSGLLPKSLEGIQLYVPDRFAPGDPFKVTIRVEQTEDTLCQAGWLVLGLRNKATGVIPWRTVVPIRSTLTSVLVENESIAEPDLHTLRLVYVRGMQIACFRRRIVGTGRIVPQCI